jgi:DNA repair protein RecN (Recombination protein N)
MLKKLYIQNYALISKLDLDFNGGLNVITGETGAGKSIIIGALGLILGNRADISVVNNSGSKCIIEGAFENTSKIINSFLESNDLDIEQELHIRREITLSGKSRAFVNDTPVSLTVLKYLASHLVDVNSQNQTYIFRNPEMQLSILDDLSNSRSILADYKLLYLEYKKAQKDLKELINREEEAAKQKDFIQFQFDELDDSDLNEGEEEELKRQLEWMNNAEKIKQVLYSATQILNQSDEGVNDKIESIISQLVSLNGLHPKYDELEARMNSVLIELQDIASEYENLFEETEFDPEQHSIIQDRNDIILHLQQKHRKNTVTELLELKNSFESQLLSIDSLAEDISKLYSQIENIEKQLKAKADELSESRRKSIKHIELSIVSSLQNLGMKDANFIIDINTVNGFKENGIDELSFLFSSNKGHEPAMISKIASGGELSRLVLSLKSLYSESNSLPTVIFDEIDTGVSGDIASKVGNTMLKMSNNMQVIAITHLPQIAAKSKWHYKVYKKEIEGVTHSDIRLLNKNEQLEELALMLSGDASSKQALRMAKELKSSII